MDNLRKRRDAAGLSRWQLAKLADVPPQTIYDIEQNHINTGVETALKLAKALDTTVEDLMGTEKVR